jgi:HSP20 family molecular chaperone IbpA
MKKTRTKGFPQVAEGAFKATRRSGWRYCLVGMDDRAIVCEFANGRRRLIPLGNIVDSRIEQQKIGLGDKPTLVLEYKHDCGSTRRIWLNLEEPRRWKDGITDLCLPEVNAEDVLGVIKYLSLEAADLLNYLWERRHATIDELVEVIGAASHMEVIALLKKEINPALEKRLGKALAEFRDLREDPVTGEKVRNSWWLLGVNSTEKHSPPRTIDTFDEGGYVSIVIEPFGIPCDELEMELVGNQLVVSIGGEVGDQEQIIPLPPQVSWGGISCSLNNGVLVINVSKLQSG